MIKSVFLIIGLILFVLGLCEIIHSVALFIASPRGPYKSCHIIWLRSDRAINQLRFARLQYRWLGDAYTRTVVAITDLIGDEEMKFYKNSFREGFVFCPSSAVEDIIRSVLGE